MCTFPAWISTQNIGASRNLFSFILGLGIFFWCTPLFASSLPSPPFYLNNKGLAVIRTPAGETIFAEVADTAEEQSRGLMFRTTMAPDHGMLFTFHELDYWTFWMKNTKMPLDIIWLDQDGRIVHIEHNVPICQRTDNGCPRYRPRVKALSVLELRAGQAKKFHLRPGAQLSIQLP
ncbi:MAG: DUF192 domain-containing protein [Nitrospirae bacterium]|nr:MAG: DUF192 domain-containing protein [Nitrospirota bacterium]